MTAPTTRRTLLGLAGGLALLRGRWAAALEEAASPSSGGEDYWRMVRRLFAFAEDRVPLNAANLCPSPRAVTERVVELTRAIDDDCSFQSRSRFDELLERSRSLVASHLGAAPDEIALVRNTSEANNTINNGLDLGSGDEVLIWDQNHPTNHVAWEVRAARNGFRVEKVSTPTTPTGADELVAAFADALTPRTRVLAVTELSNVSGVRLPIRELCAVAHRRGIWVHVDGAQSWGALTVDLHRLGCDSYSASAHKWLCGPREVGVLYVKRDRVPEVWPQGVAPGWGDDADPDVEGARKFESLGQRDDARLAALADAIELHLAIGPERIAGRVQELAQRYKAGVAELGLPLSTPRDPLLSGGVCIVPVRAERREELFDLLYRRYGLIGAPTGGLRICPHFYNTMEHVDRAIAALGELRDRVVA